jgi:hypothetical protein
MPQLARYLQEAFERNCPRGWRCRTEARVVTAEVEELLGYAPQADAVLQEVATGRRVWVVLKILDRIFERYTFGAWLTGCRSSVSSGMPGMP